MPPKKSQNLEPQEPKEARILFYTTPSGGVQIEVRFEDKTVWLSQKKLAELFGVDVNTVGEHLQNIYKSAEQSEDRTSRKFRVVQMEGSREVAREISFYSLDAIIAVGYRVNSENATRFRQWATRTLGEYVLKGFVLDDERLKNGTHFGEDYFEYLLERIRDIRLSERRLHQKVTDIFETASDYDGKTATARTFFAFVQNKLHFAITGHTAAEIILDRADSEKRHMGLTSWEQAPSGKIMKPDVRTAKNYLDETELGGLRDIVSAFIEAAEVRAKRGVPTTMKQWTEFMDTYLKALGQDVLQDAGRISHEAAVEHAETEFEKFRPIQDRAFISGADKQAMEALEQAADEEKKKISDEQKP